MRGPAIRFVIACLAALTAFVSCASAVEAKPNILLILADDLGYADLGFQGSKDIPTPHLDRLAGEGVRFTDGYVTSVMCSPSRAGILAGRSQSRFGHEINWPPDLETNPNDTRGLPLDEKNIADHLKAAGYTTGLVGKWHLGEAPPFHPNKRGFDEFFGFVGGGKNYFCELLTPTPPKNKSAHYLTLLERNGAPEKATGYLTTVLGREASAFIIRHGDKPWFLFASFNAPHIPLQATPELLERVKGIPDEARRTYAAMVAGMDDAIGEILATLKTTGQEDRTLVFFLSDNGGPLKKSGSRNDPLSGGKGEVLEGGIRVPFTFRWPGVVPPGSTYTRPVSSLDILPTALAAAGAKSIADKPLDGVNLVPFLTGAAKGDPHEFLFWRVLPRRIWAVRSGDDKLTQNRFRTPRLFDLSKDVAEKNDLAAAKPERASELQAAWERWAANLPAPRWGMEGEKEE